MSYSSSRSVCRCAISFIVCSIVLTQVTNANSQPLQGSLTFTVFAGPNRLQSVDYSYDGSSFSLSTPTVIATVADGLNGADGVDLDPNDGLILVAGQNGGVVYKVDPNGPIVSSAPAGGAGVFHLTIDPDLSRVWTAGQPGNLKQVPIGPAFGTPGTVLPLVGDDTAVTQVLFTPLGNAFYTRSPANGVGNFGSIDLSTNPAQTTRIHTNMAGLHGGVYDPFSGDLLVFGSNRMLQIDIVDGSVIAERTFAANVSTFDQGAVDGMGHVFVAVNNGNLVFMDYSATGLIDSPGNFVSIQFLANSLDDVAPILGPPQPCVAVPDEIASVGATTIHVVLPSQPGGGTADITLVPLVPGVVASITPPTFLDVSLDQITDLDFEVELQCVANQPDAIAVGFEVVVAGEVLCETAVVLVCADFVETEFLRGDCNSDGIVNIADVVWTLNQLFAGGAESTCANACDSTDDETIDILDAIFTANYRFLMGPTPSTPFPDCGVDPTLGVLDCAVPSCP